MATANTTQTMSEAISLSTGEVPLSFILVEPARIAGEYEQILGRGLRYGQTGEFRLYSLISTLSESDRRAMEQYMKMMEEAGIRIRETWEPNTVHEDRYITCRGQRLESQQKLTDEGMRKEHIIEVLSPRDEPKRGQGGQQYPLRAG